jgi:hypothetical protein
MNKFHRLQKIKLKIAGTKQKRRRIGGAFLH